MTSAEDIKAKLDIVEVIREYIQVKPAGRNFQALCPFHNEKTPSFTISPDKQIWHCFGCGKGGDVFTFVMEKEVLTFGEALRLLAVKAGVVLPEYSPELNQQRNRLLDILQIAAAYYQRALADNAAAEPARQYLVERGLNQETIDDWQIGFSPDSWDDLIILLKSKNFSERDIAAAGLAVQQAGGSRYFNRFRGRIMFPLYDVNANIVGFTARVLPINDGKDGMGKYVNSPQSEVFDKSKILFGLHRAKTAIRELGYAIMVEGQLDAITAHQFGFKNVVASSGTALTDAQVQLLDRYTNNLIFALDADVAGQTATDRAGATIANLDVKVVAAPDRWGRLKNYIDPARSFKKNIKVALLPPGKDPDQFIRQDKAGWIRALQESKSLAEYYFTKSISDLDLSTAPGRRQAVERFLPFVARQLNPVERDFWLKKLSQAIDTDPKFLYEVLNKFNAEQPAGAASVLAETVPEAVPREQILSEHLLALACKFPAQVNYLLDQLMPEHLVGSEVQTIYKALILFYNQNANPGQIREVVFALNYADWRAWLNKNFGEAAANFLDKLIIVGEKEFYNFEETTAGLEVKKIVRNLKQSYLSERLKATGKLIGELEGRGGSKEELDALLREFNNLTQELRKILDYG